MKKVKIVNSLVFVLMLVFVMSVQVSAASTTYDSLIVRRADLPTVTYDGKNVLALKQWVFQEERTVCIRLKLMVTIV